MTEVAVEQRISSFFRRVGEGETSYRDTCFDLAQRSYQMALTNLNQRIQISI